MVHEWLQYVCVCVCECALPIHMCLRMWVSVSQFQSMWNWRQYLFYHSFFLSFAISLCFVDSLCPEWFLSFRKQTPQHTQFTTIYFCFRMDKFNNVSINHFWYIVFIRFVQKSMEEKNKPALAVATECVAFNLPSFESIVFPLLFRIHTNTSHFFRIKIEILQSCRFDY